MPSSSFLAKLEALPLGACQGTYRDRTYLVSKEVLGDGKIIKLYARETDGRDFVSANVYLVRGEWRLKPCEMPAQKVVRFVDEVRLGS